MMKVDWSSLWRKEDWMAVWLGFILLALASMRIITYIPKVGRWEMDPSVAINATDIPYFILLGLGILLLTSMAARENIKAYSAGFPLIFFLALVSILIANQQLIHYFGLEYVIWALMIGLMMSNIAGVPNWLKPAIRSELFIKIGLVLLGAEILFSVLLKGGISGMIQALVVVFSIWYFCYFLALKVGMSKSFASVMATGVSICGVSAAIAAGTSIKADPKEVSYTISMVLLTSVVMLVGIPLIAKMLELPPAVAGAWIGGTIDTTGAVVAAGALYSEKAMIVASIVKMSQNVLIGVTAFLLAIYWVLKVERKPGEKPSAMEIWYRFPKFIVGFMVASIAFSFLLIPMMGEVEVKSILSITKGLREWFFSMCFLCIGLETRFKDLIEVGGKKAAGVYCTAQIANILLVFILAWLLFGGILLPPPLI